MYLKWLHDENGARVSERDAMEAFKDSGKTNAEVVAEEGWTFVPVLGLSLDEWVSILIRG